MSESLGVIKLVGIAGLVEGEIYWIRPGENVSIGRSRECGICLRSAKKFLALPVEQRTDDQFKSVSRVHASVEFKSAKELIITDQSSNGTFIDGQKVSKTVTLASFMKKSFVLKLGATEKLKVEYKKLVKRKKIAIVKVAPGEKPPAGAVPVDDADLAPPEDSVEPALMDDLAPMADEDPDRTDVPATKGAASKAKPTTKPAPAAKEPEKPATRKLTAKKGS